MSKIVNALGLRQHLRQSRLDAIMISFGQLLLYAAALYFGAGVITSVLFFAYGASKLAHGAPVSFGARILFLPGAILLWPLILKRWFAGAVQ